jgi:hypothetical protein
MAATVSELAKARITQNAKLTTQCKAEEFRKPRIYTEQHRLMIISMSILERCPKIGLLGLRQSGVYAADSFVDLIPVFEADHHRI